MNLISLEICVDCGEAKSIYSPCDCKKQEFCPRGHVGDSLRCKICHWQELFSKKTVRFVEITGGVVAKCGEGHYVLGTRLELAGGCPLCRWSSVVKENGAELIPAQIYCHGIINYVRVRWADGENDFIVYGDEEFEKRDDPLSRYVGCDFSADYAEYYQCVKVAEACCDYPLWARRPVDGDIVIGSALFGMMFAGNPIAPKMLGIRGLNRDQLIDSACHLFGWDRWSARENYSATLRNCDGFGEKEMFSDLTEHCTSHRIPYYLDESLDSWDESEMCE